jgi:hypothetical protein
VVTNYRVLYLYNIGAKIPQESNSKRCCTHSSYIQGTYVGERKIR